MSLSVAALVSVTVLLLAGCGSQTGDQTGDAGDAAGGAETPQPSSSAPTPESRPTGPPWPAYPVEDYRYELRVSCFCPYAGMPLTVTVEDGTVTDVVYARTAHGHRAGEHVDVDWLRLTIDDIIDRANDPAAATVKVRWPRGQDHPSWVWIDRAANAVDDEVGYRIRDVRTE